MEEQINYCIMGYARARAAGGLNLQERLNLSYFRISGETRARDRRPMFLKLDLDSTDMPTTTTISVIFLPGNADGMEKRAQLFSRGASIITYREACLYNCCRV